MTSYCRLGALLVALLPARALLSACGSSEDDDSSGPPSRALRGKWKAWLERAMAFVAERAKDPPAASRAYGLVSVAMADAAAAAWHWKYHYNREPLDGKSSVSRAPDPSYPSEHAAMAGAASRVLAYAYPEQPKARLEEQAEDATRSRVTSGADLPSDADAGLELGDTKFAYWFPRPKNGVRDLGVDRRWEPYLATPFFPAYVSGHSTYSSAAGEVLAHLFPEDSKVWRARAEEAGISRLYGGIHWAIDHTEGAKIGRKIGRLAVERAEEDGAER